MTTAAADELWMRALLQIVRRSQMALPYKATIARLLDANPGEAVVDLGSGLGDDVAELHARVAPHGMAFGIDKAYPEGHAGGEFVVSDLAALPLTSSSVDAARIDRVLHLLPNPSETLSEVARVLRPGGRVVVAEPDNRSLAFPGLDDPVTRAVVDARGAGAFGGPDGLALTLVKLARAAGLEPDEPCIETVDFDDFALVRVFFGIGPLLQTLIADGIVSSEAASEWLGAREADHAAGLFRARFSGCILRAVVPTFKGGLQ